MKQQIGSINFLRGLFALIICAGHLSMGLGSNSPLLQKLPAILPDLNIITNAFFIISGIFLMESSRKNTRIYMFALNRINRLYPTLVFFVFMMFVLHLYNAVDFSIQDSIFTLSFLNSVGITNSHGYTAWYVSVLFWSMLLFFSLSKIFSTVAFGTVVSLIVFISGVLCYKFYGELGGTWQITGTITSAGMLRALNGIGSGIIIFMLNEQIETKQYKIAFTCIDIACITFLFISKSNQYNNFIYLILMFFLLFSLYSKSGLEHYIFDNRFCDLFGKYSYSLYMTHFALIYVFAGSFWYKANCVSKYPVFCFFAIILFCILFSVLVYHTVECNNSYRKYALIFIIMLSIPALLLKQLPVIDEHTYKFNHFYGRVSVSKTAGIDWAAWFKGKEGQISFKVSDKQQRKMIATFFPYVSNLHPLQTVEAFIDDKMVGKWVFEYGKDYPSVEIHLPPRKNQTIIFKFPNAISPKALRERDDDRDLSVALVKIIVKKCFNDDHLRGE